MTSIILGHVTEYCAGFHEVDLAEAA
jgi:hypothetical protein